MNTLCLLLLTVLPLCSQELILHAPNREFDFVDQKNGAGNSCGPASLLNAFGSGSEKWQIVFQKIPGTSDRTRIASVIKSWGLAPSANLPDRKRWDRKGGTNFIDLGVMADEMRQLHWSLPKLKSEFFFSAPGAESEAHLKLAHKRLRTSLKKGFPPLLSVRRFVLRDNQWQSVHGHYVILVAMPKKIAWGSQSFAVEFIDPTGAKTYRGEITTSNTLPSLILTCPTSAIGKSEIKLGEQNALGLAGAIGAW